MCVVSSNQLPARKTTLSCGLSLYIADRCAVRGIMNQPNVGQRKEGFFTMALDYESIGKRIKGYRTQRNISQEELSERINAGPRYITKVENAVIRPSLESMVYIANALNVSSDDLLHDNLTVSTSILHFSNLKYSRAFLRLYFSYTVIQEISAHFTFQFSLTS